MRYIYLLLILLLLSSVTLQKKEEKKKNTNNDKKKEKQEKQEKPNLTKEQLEIQKMATHTQKFQCKGSSPFFNIKYEQKQLTQVSGQLFCTDQAKRTCCSPDNFEQLKTQWFMYNFNHNNISSSCQINFSELACMDCDGDIGIGTRQGICPDKCIELYESCRDDLFKIDDSQHIKYCNKNDLICSPLTSIAQDPFEFCNTMGFKVNQEHIDYDHWKDDIKILKNQTEFQPVCYNGKPSAHYFGLGSATNTTASTSTKKTRKTRRDNRSFLQKYGVFISVGMLIFMFFGIILYIVLLRKKSNKISAQFGNTKGQFFKGKATKLE